MSEKVQHAIFFVFCALVPFLYPLSRRNLAASQYCFLSDRAKRTKKAVKELQKLASGEEFIISDAIIAELEQSCEKISRKNTRRKKLTKQVNSKAKYNKEFYIPRYLSVAGILPFLFYFISVTEALAARALYFSINICSRCSV